MRAKYEYHSELEGANGLRHALSRVPPERRLAEPFGHIMQLAREAATRGGGSSRAPGR